MPKVKNVEKKVWDTEGFAIRIKANGKDVRSDRNGFPQFKGGKASRNSWTVAEWKRKKFDTQYPGLDVEVLDGDGIVVDGRRSLANVRDTYIEETDDE